MPRADVTANNSLASLGRYWRDSRTRYCSRADIPAWRPQKLHYCIIGSDNGLPPGRNQAIIWTSAGILLIGPLGTNFSETVIDIQTFSLKKMRLKMSSTERQPFCLGLNVLDIRWWRGLDPSSSTIALTGPQFWIVTRAAHGTWRDYHMSVGQRNLSCATKKMGSFKFGINPMFDVLQWNIPVRMYFRPIYATSETIYLTLEV